MKYIETLKYAHELEGKLRIQRQEIEKLQYLTQFMIMNQQKREDMISHLFEENRRLKDTLEKNQRALLKVKNINLIPAPSLVRKKSCESSQKSAGILKEKKDRICFESSLSEMPVLNNGSNVNIITNTLTNIQGANRQRNSIKKGGSRTYRVFDENSLTAHQHILNMNLSAKAEKLLYEDNEYVTTLGPIIAEQDVFIDYVANNDISNLIVLFDALTGLFNEHKSLHNLIFRLKKIIKASNVMTSSLILAESIEKIVDETVEFLECDRATVFILDEKKEELWSKVAKGSDFTIRIPMDKGIVGHVVVSGKSVNILDAYSDERFNKNVDLKSNYRTKTILCSPIVDINNRVTGAIQAINKINGSFSKDDEGLLEILANIAGVILRNSLHYDEQLLFQNNLRHILKNGIRLNSIFSFDQLIPHAERVLRNTMNVDQARIYLLNKEEGVLVHFNETDREFFDCRSGIVGYVVRTREVESIANAYSHPLFNGQIDIETTLPIICMPIIQDEDKEVVGAFEVLNPKGLQSSIIKQKSKISGVEYEILQFFRLQLAQIIANIMEWDKMKGVNMLSQKKK